ncbi:hypothetical protein F5050DRAFT_1732591 [Lentinula boryana]|uniref:Uncharacterized protein n=1 Tax=Lentinula boryana TaxID=40481 RepID=A0ABQ8QP93_9AGAR|nr:hypothetical protein F5050DRAFT_1732591 [Lentinula boryana]
MLYFFLKSLVALSILGLSLSLAIVNALSVPKSSRAVLARKAQSYNAAKTLGYMQFMSQEAQDHFIKGNKFNLDRFKDCDPSPVYTQSVHALLDDETDLKEDEDTFRDCIIFDTNGLIEAAQKLNLLRHFEKKEDLPKKMPDKDKGKGLPIAFTGVQTISSSGLTMYLPITAIKNNPPTVECGPPGKWNGPEVDWTKFNIPNLPTKSK